MYFISRKYNVFMTLTAFDPATDRVRLRIFPADAVSPQRAIAQCLVIVGKDAVYLYKDGRVTPELAFSERLDDMFQDPKGLVLMLSNGERMVVKKGGGCGCGSRLKNWMPPHVGTAK